MKTSIFFVSVAFVMTSLLVGCSGTSHRSVTIAFKEDVVDNVGLYNALSAGKTPTPCKDSNIDSGAGVRLSDEHGTLLGSGTFGKGINDVDTCDYRVIIKDVPTDRRQYVVTDDAVSGTIASAKSDMQKHNWTVGVSISSGDRPGD